MTNKTKGIMVSHGLVISHRFPNFAFVSAYELDEGDPQRELFPSKILNNVVVGE